MLEKLKQRWGVNGINLMLIITTFAIGGSCCGYLGRKLLNLAGLESGIIWITLYIITVTILWPLCVLLISIPLGQFNFFKKYLQKISKRFKKKVPEVKHIAIFASGAGSNAAKIIAYFQHHPFIKVQLVVTNNAQAGVIRIAEKANIELLIINKPEFNSANSVVDALKSKSIHFIVLAGFLWKIPNTLIKAFPNKIINIHPALLPKFGGKGMYGNRVHEAVIAAQEKESGITIHYVDELYDHGPQIAQFNCSVTPSDTPESLAAKIHTLEHQHFAPVIESVVTVA
jgi:formyltetrahydrofolate-dependent phosphoribosylglycinamide formyltransferase